MAGERRGMPAGHRCDQSQAAARRESGERRSRLGSCPGGARRRPAPDRLPARARARADLPGAGLPRRAAAVDRRRCPPSELGVRVDGGTLTELKGVGEDDRRGDRARRSPARCRRTCAKLEAEVDRAGRSAGGAALRAALRGDCHTHSDWSDGGSPIDEMARAARDLGHEYLVLTDHSPRLTVANGLSPERLRAAARRRRRAQRGAGAVPHPDRHRGRHPRRRRARPGRRAAGPARRRRRQRALQAADGPRATMTRRMVDRGRQPAHRRPRALHRPASSRGGRGSGRSRSSTPSWSSRPAGSSTSRSRSTPGPSGSTRRGGCCRWPSRRAACSRSTPTRTRRASSTGSPTAASGPRSAGSRPTGWSTRSRSSDLLAWTARHA